MNPLSYSPRSQVKALVAGLVAALTYLVAVDADTFASFVLDDVLESLLAFLVAYGATFSVPNRA